MVELFAKLFGFIAREVVETCGETGRGALVRAVERFGEERGQGIAQRAKLRGLSNTPENYLASYDMDRSSDFASVADIKDGELEQVFSRCAIARQFASDGLEQYGRLYCDNIDPALARGFNPDMECLHPEHFFDNGCCRFIFRIAKEKKND
ncbi:MAG: L-2-amino-thiazoline-4-carboxylic acid hydrolase [Deltaproteobacteria bacterium]|nr:L-2-amino-thiazoline-4-carboxylic acid hydrolase [Deltaproteobacteria bacterium]